MKYVHVIRYPHECDSPIVNCYGRIFLRPAEKKFTANFAKYDFPARVSFNQ